VKTALQAKAAIIASFIACDVERRYARASSVSGSYCITQAGAQDAAHVPIASSCC
jgi:hypothetical protein